MCIAIASRDKEQEEASVEELGVPVMIPTDLMLSIEV